MAVRHGYGKIAGTDALVFAYDTGDTRNSFKGEPTVNHISGGSNVADCINGPINYGAQGGVTVNATIEYYSEKRPHIFRIKSTNDTGYNMINQQSSILNQSGTTYTYSYDFKQLRGSTQQDSSCTVYGNGYKSPDSSGYSSNVSIVNTPLEDGWTRRAITYTATYTGYNWYRFNLWTGGARADGAGDFEFLFDNFQIETNSHATPFTNNTRSETEGLLDLTANAEIDLSNVSFDSNAQIAFDGTNDYINLGNSTVYNQFTGDFTIAALVKRYPNGGTWGTIIGDYYTSGTALPDEWQIMMSSSGQLFLYNYGYEISPIASGFGANTWVYVVVTRIGSTVTMYANGNVIATTTSTKKYGGDTGNLNIGIDGNNSAEPFTGEIDVVQIYNRGLTTTEVLQNFNHYKTRYNL